MRGQSHDGRRSQQCALERFQCFQGCLLVEAEGLS
jgi:hypothetical protein